jgi:hypothetical protein
MRQAELHTPTRARCTLNEVFSHCISSGCGGDVDRALKFVVLIGTAGRDVKTGLFPHGYHELYS